MEAQRMNTTNEKPPGLSVLDAGIGQPESDPGLRTRLTTLVGQANAGDRAALASLRRLLDQHPELWTKIGDLATHAESTWITLLAGEDHLLVESVKKQVSEMKTELAGPHPTATERLLVDRVVACWLAMQHAEMNSAQTGGSSVQVSIRLKRAETNQKRYLSAIKMLTLVRAKLSEGLAPLNTLRVFTKKKRRA
jgi:hypothetical protein